LFNKGIKFTNTMSANLLAQASQNRLINNAPVVVICLLIVDSLHFVFARLLLPHLPPTTSAMYVLGIATVEVAVFMGIWDKINLETFRRHTWFFLNIGFLVAASTVLTYGSVAFIDPGTASLLGKMSTLFSLGFGLIWLRERFTALEWLGVLAAIVGTFVIAFQPGEFLWLGVLMVIVSTFMYALHAALVKRHGQGMGLADFFLFRLVCTTAFLFLFSAGRGELTLPSWPAWLILLLTGTVDVTISRALYYLTLRRLNLSLHAIILTLSPVASILWTLVLFNISPTWQQLIGGMAVIGGVLLVSTSQTRGVEPKEQ
jgi:drug/metabolite transporter (DMT)-like permease